MEFENCTDGDNNTKNDVKNTKTHFFATSIEKCFNIFLYLFNSCTLTKCNQEDLDFILIIFDYLIDHNFIYSIYYRNSKGIH